MADKLHLHDLFEDKRYQKLTLVLSVAAVLFLEMVIYMIAASQAGERSRVIITNDQGAKVYETRGGTLTSYERLNFENTFGPLESYNIEVRTETRPFPFRAWMTTAVGVPVGLILLLAFVVRVYLSLLSGDARLSRKDEERAEGGDPLRKFFNVFEGISIFHVGVLVMAGVLLLWMVPNFMRDAFRFGVETVREFKWFFLGAAVFLGLLVAWVVYLRYRLSRRMIDNQLDLEKYRVERQLLLEGDRKPLLPEVLEDIQGNEKGMNCDG